MEIPQNVPEDVLLSYENCAGSDYRELLLKRAKDHFANGEIGSSIFYQTKCLCVGFESRYSGRSEKEKERQFDETTTLYSKVLKYAAKRLKAKGYSYPTPPEEGNSLNDASSSSEGLRWIQEFCSSLPKEWTVIQLCKEQRNDTSYSTFREIFAADSAIYLSILKHPRSKEFPEPNCLRLTAANQSQMFEKFSVLTNLFTEYSVLPTGPKSTQDLENYWSGMAILESRVADAVSELKTFMGPWVSLLCGSVKKPYEERQQKIFETVDTFCENHNFNSEQRVLLSLLAQQRHLLSEEHIKQASLSLAANCANGEGEEENEETSTSRVIYEFLMQIPSEGEIAFGPCILILDERIDHFYWEVLNPWQELCRMSSFNILVRLFERYKSRIKNGYLTVNVEQGHCVVNPDCNLPNMEERMKSFFNYWLPHWKCTYNIVPKVEDFMKIFDESDCYVYCGHGSGLQYVNGRKISKFQMKCIVFLFGCDSVRLRSQGLHSEMVGSHMYYHAALCPAVVGTLQLGFDFQVDKIATTLLSEWIPSSTEDVVHWHHIDKASWKKGSIKSLHSKNARIQSDHYEGSLAQVVCTIHQKTDEKLYNTVGFVYRGLPAWNSNNSQL